MHSMLRRTFVLLALLALPISVAAQTAPPVTIDPGSFGPLCSATGLCFGSAPIGVGLVLAFLQNLVLIIRTVFIGVCAAYFAWFALMLIMKGSEENTLTEQRKAFGNAAIGMGIVGVAGLMVQTFAPSAVGSSLVDPTPFAEGVERIVTYLTLVVGAFLIFVISLSGFRLIVLQGNESEIEKLRKHFFNGLIGIIILLVARVIVNAIIPTGSGPESLVSEIAGMAKFLLEIVAGLAILSFVVAGMFYLLSLHSDERKQRAKRILIATVIILLIVVLSHTLVATFIR